MSSTEQPLPLPDAPHRLAMLVQEIDRQSSLGVDPHDAWATSRDDAHPVLIVGGGQAGLALAVGLRRKGISNVLIVEQSGEGQAGPWATYARMKTLRTPKNVPWPTWGIPAASPRSWFESVFGADAWRNLTYYPTSHWHAFLEWYRITLGIAVEFDTAVQSIEGGHNARPFVVRLRTADGERTVEAEHVVLATGLEGAGGRRVPTALFAAIPDERWSHSHDTVDFSSLAGARIGILGGGTGAFDNAATALEAGVQSVEVHMRRPSMPTSSPYRWMDFAGLIEHYDAFNDHQKWRFNAHLSQVDQPATQNAIWRAYAFPTFSLHTSSPWQSVVWNGSEIEVHTPNGVSHFDFIVAATGVTVNLSHRPELSEFVHDIATWGDRLPVSQIEADQTPELQSYPYLTADFGLTSRSIENEERLRRVHLFNHGARMSLGVLSHQVSGLQGGAERLAAGIGERLFSRRSDALIDQFLAYDEPAGVVLGPRPETADDGVMSGALTNG
ncbi:NAD(P)-binding domain-containing protein [Agreia pratensis]|uniref:Predicted flavoprotein CzcO associated with the cation diffusion facilitator CzcD n=1 Tax=Agreia pratensis TaxID=150121 RepID=A0A1X7L070_9MICO|nr:NAD(P)/FAD-dependent oxidoreductase [Agreia pratensis]SMG46539.1 Predicted flavoprotein CzcO associated with the cation diffusion facilitator CzcD [Agreia pratensis]